jgi:hypothetical protein
MRASVRHREQAIQRKLAEARAVVRRDAVADPPDSDSGEPTAESLGLVARRSTQYMTPEQPNRDRPTCPTSVCTHSAPLTAQRYVQDRTPTVCCTASLSSPRVCVRAGELGRLIPAKHGENGLPSRLAVTFQSLAAGCRPPRPAWAIAGGGRWPHRHRGGGVPLLAPPSNFRLGRDSCQSAGQEPLQHAWVCWLARCSGDERLARARRWATPGGIDAAAPASPADIGGRS